MLPLPLSRQLPSPPPFSVWPSRPLDCRFRAVSFPCPRSLTLMPFPFAALLLSFPGCVFSWLSISSSVSFFVPVFTILVDRFPLSVFNRAGRPPACQAPPIPLVCRPLAFTFRFRWSLPAPSQSQVPFSFTFSLGRSCWIFPCLPLAVTFLLLFRVLLFADLCPLTALMLLPPVLAPSLFCAVPAFCCLCFFFVPLLRPIVPQRRLLSFLLFLFFDSRWSHFGCSFSCFRCMFSLGPFCPPCTWSDPLVPLLALVFLLASGPRCPFFGFGGVVRPSFGSRVFASFPPLSRLAPGRFLPFSSLFRLFLTTFLLLPPVKPPVPFSVSLTLGLPCVFRFDFFWVSHPVPLLRLSSCLTAAFLPLLFFALLFYRPTIWSRSSLFFWFPRLSLPCSWFTPASPPRFPALRPSYAPLISHTLVAGFRLPSSAFVVPRGYFLFTCSGRVRRPPSRPLAARVFSSAFSPHLTFSFLPGFVLCPFLFLPAR